MIEMADDEYLAYCTNCGRGMNPGDRMCCPRQAN